MNSLSANEAPVSLREQNQYIDTLLSYIAKYMSPVPVSNLKVINDDFQNKIVVSFVVLRMVTENLIKYHEEDKGLVVLDKVGYECMAEDGYLNHIKNRKRKKWEKRILIIMAAIVGSILTWMLNKIHC